jgi:hypothetical protein
MSVSVVAAPSAVEAAQRTQGRFRGLGVITAGGAGGSGERGG